MIRSQLRCSRQLPQYQIACLQHQAQVRYAHMKRHSSSTTSQISRSDATSRRDQTSSKSSPQPPLSILPLSTLIRSYIITSVSASPFLLRPSLGILSFLAHSKSAFLNPDQNPVLRYLLKKTFYAQFCAGETPIEVKKSVNNLKRLGYSGVILGYGREVVMDENEVSQVEKNEQIGTAETDRAEEEIMAWKKGTVETVELADNGDFVALKFTGAGKQALRHLSHGLSPSPSLEKAIIDICELAEARNVRLLFDAEQHSVQGGIDAWTLDFQQRYNKDGRALVYGTYQAYLRSTPTTLASHLAAAKSGDFGLGVKLVRGAYLGSDPRHLMWDRKEKTDEMYNGIAESLIRSQYGEVLKPISTDDRSFPNVNLVLASHNGVTVQKAKSIRNEQMHVGDKRIDMVYGQLMGMADNISCKLVHEGHEAAKELRESSEATVDVPRAYKYLVWGTIGECTKYLLRRAEENRDAVTRTEEGKRALGQELARRISAGLRFSR